MKKLFSLFILFSLFGCAQMNEIEKTLKDYNYVQNNLICKVWFDNDQPIIVNSYPYTINSFKWHQRELFEIGQFISIIPINEKMFQVQFFAKTKETDRVLYKNEKDELDIKIVTKEHIHKINSQNNLLYKIGVLYEDEFEFEIVFDNKQTKFIKNKLICFK